MQFDVPLLSSFEQFTIFERKIPIEIDKKILNCLRIKIFTWQDKTLHLFNFIEIVTLTK